MTAVICGLGLGLGLGSVFGESFTKCTLSLPYVLFLTFVTFYHVKFVDLQFICCLISRTSPVLLNVYVVLPSCMWGQVRHPCLE